MEFLDSRADATFLIAGGDDYGKQLERSRIRGWRIHASAVTSNQRGFASACPAISLQMASMGVWGVQFQTSFASDESRTSHGTSNGRVSLEPEMLPLPNRFSHHALNSRSDSL